MARKNRSSYEAYPKDAFDTPPAGPAGTHRGSRSVVSRTVPFLVVIIVAALLGLLAWSVYSGQLKHVRFPWSAASSSQTVTTTTTVKASDSATSDTSADASASASDSTSQSPSDAATSESTSSTAQNVNKATSIRVINATNKSGHAASKASVLTGDGYTNVAASNPSGQVPSTTVVWYQNETDQATAQDVASSLGITAVQQQSGIAAPIVVVLLD